MKKSIKFIVRPIAKFAIACLEKFTGFRTDRDGYLPNRVKMVTRSYERSIVHQMCANVPRGGTFIDVGANVGYVSRAVAEYHDGNCMVFAFEPNPKIYPILLSNLHRFPNITCNQTALGMVSGKAQFYVGCDSCVGTLLQGCLELQHLHDGSQFKVRQFDVPINRGDEVLEECPVIDVMKIDVEGYEEEVLRGCANLIEQGKIHNIFMELAPLAQKPSGRHPLSAVNYLRQLGYDIFGTEGDVQGDELLDSDLELLVESLGERGYTTVRATRIT